MDDRERWEARYRRDDAPTSLEPWEVLKAHADAFPGGPALDVATGAGRDALFLAARGHTVEAIDVSRTALALARDRARKRELTVNWIQADVATFPFAERRYGVITVSRFDARPRLDALREALAPGGVFVYVWFLEGGDGGPPDRHRFAPGELRAACSDLEVEHYDETDGRVALVARRLA